MSKDRVSPSGRTASIKGTVALTHGTIATGAVLEATVAFVGVRAGDIVSLSPAAALDAGLALSHGRWSANDVVAIGLANLLAASATPTAVTWNVLVQRF